MTPRGPLDTIAHMEIRRRWAALRVSSALGYTLALVVPTALTFVVAWFRWPAFLFEHVALLVVLGFAMRWGLGPAIVASLAAVSADNVLLREPIGQPAISGVRDALDLLLFATVGVIISILITRIRAERAAAQAAAQRERRAREDRDRLVGAVSHDLATPLSVISANLQFARLQRITEQDLKRLLTRMETATLRATALVQTLADAKALDDDALALDLHAMDLRRVVAPLVEMFDRLSERHTVLCAVPERPIIIEGDADRLRRVVENLISNAIKYSPEGGSVEVTVDATEDHALVSVRDYGIGVSAESLPHIFDRHYRAAEATRSAPGLGLGLSIAAEIVARHRGSIEVTPTDPCGATFTVRLPLSPAGALSRRPRRLRSAP